MIDAAIEKYISLAQAIVQDLPKRHGTPPSDMIKPTWVLWCKEKNDSQAINNVCNDPFFNQSLGLNYQTPTATSIRTRLEKEAREFIPPVN